MDLRCCHPEKSRTLSKTSVLSGACIACINSDANDGNSFDDEDTSGSGVESACLEAFKTACTSSAGVLGGVGLLLLLLVVADL